MTSEQPSQTLCPVCGYDLKLPSSDVLVDRCECCGFTFMRFTTKLKYDQFDPDNLFVRMHRGSWMVAHMRWRSEVVQPPENWDPVKQMYAIGINLGESFEAWSEQHPEIRPENKDKFLKLALERLAKLEWKPKVVEVLWDGDTEGWFLVLSVSADTPSEYQPYTMHDLFGLRGAGGDFRLFAGLVLPYPEAYILGYVGEELSKKLGIPFYFPSADACDDYARWYERDEKHRCKDCRRYLTHHVKKDVCWLCERAEK